MILGFFKSKYVLNLTNTNTTKIFLSKKKNIILKHCELHNKQIRDDKGKKKQDIRYTRFDNMFTPQSHTS